MEGEGARGWVGGQLPAASASRLGRLCPKSPAGSPQVQVNGEGVKRWKVSRRVRELQHKSVHGQSPGSGCLEQEDKCTQDGAGRRLLLRQCQSPHPCRLSPGRGSCTDQQPPSPSPIAARAGEELLHRPALPHPPLPPELGRGSCSGRNHPPHPSSHLVWENRHTYPGGS